jgi:adenylate cyclase
MEKDQLSRKLAVILHADVVDSTTLVQKDETLAHERIQAAFHQFSETINSYGGVAHELRGDALVAEFDRASDAVTAALAFQALNEAHNATLDYEIQPQLRIGISLGEVIIADNTLTGAGVVLAQRLEQLADSGGIVVQGSVSETVPTRMPFDFESLGEQQLKGFDQPVRAFAVRLQTGKELPAPEETATLQTSIDRCAPFQQYEW